MITRREKNVTFDGIWSLILIQGLPCFALSRSRGRYENRKHKNEFVLGAIILI